MNFEIPSESSITECIQSLNCKIVNKKDSILFLSNNILLEKNIQDRFFSWLLILNILNQPKQNWGNELHQISKEYFIKFKEYSPKKKNDPLPNISKVQKMVINQELNQVAATFETFLNQPDIFSIYRVSRIYGMILNEVKNFNNNTKVLYIASVSLIFTSLFCQSVNLSPDFGESVAFYITKSIISCIPLIKANNIPQLLEEHYENIDELIKIKNPIIFAYILQNKSKSIYFAPHFEEFLFSASNHKINDVFFLWDQIFSHLNKVNSFLA